MDASAPTCSHVYCQNGLFYDAEPLRTHAQCQHCRKDSETDATLALKRCTGCFIDAYCVSSPVFPCYCCLRTGTICA